MRVQLTVLIVVLLATNTVSQHSTLEGAEINDFTTSKATGIDLSVSDVSYQYPNFGDQQKYQMFSSNHPIPNFNRPESLFVVDAVVNIEIEMTVRVENYGSTSSPLVDVNVLIIHNEYQNFEIYNLTNQISSISGQSSATTLFKFVPTYAGNHSIIITPAMTAVDDVPSNDALVGTFTVASHYFNCDNLNLWSVGQSWSSNSDTFLSQGTACHIGNGQSSTYSANLATDLITPVIDMSDAVQNPTRTNGISFYYTGSLASGDFVKIYSMDVSNSWTELASITGTIDNDLSDSANWQTWSVNHAGGFSPLIPAPQQSFHANSQFRFGFTSDSSINDIGLWMDDIVIVYDQQLRATEYGLSSTGITTSGTVPSDWGSATIELANTGNVSESFTPKIAGMPADWQYYFSTSNGVSITESNGVYLEKGQTKTIELNYRPKSGETIGFYPVTFTASSQTHPTVLSELILQLEVVPDRIPEFSALTELIRCNPGSSCFTSISITNVGGAPDVFSLSLEYDALPLGWSVSFAWNQPSEILVQPGFNVQIMLTYSVSSDAVPDSVGFFDLIATSQNDSSRTDLITVEVIASMVSNASISINAPSIQNDMAVIPGESVTVSFTVTNNASVQDIFEPNVILAGDNDWQISDVFPEQLYLNSGDSGTFSAKITAPITAQVGDDCPGYFGSAVSQRSGEVFRSPTTKDLQIAQINNIALKLIYAPDVLIPGSLNEISVELANLGNGPVPAELIIDGLPNDWQHTYNVENEQVGNTIQLGEMSDFDSKKLVIISIDIPDGTDHSQIFNLVISAFPTLFGPDIDTNDNSLDLTMVTDIVRKLVLSEPENTIYSGIGNSTSISFDINNLGNVGEQDLRIFANLYSESYDKQITSYMTIGNTGVLYDFNKVNIISLEKNSSRTVRVDLIIPEDIDINSRISFDFSLSSTNDGFESLSFTTIITVDYVREISSILSSQAGNVNGDIGALWLNISTKSSSDEQYIAKFSTPNDWQLICESAVVSSDGIEIKQELINSISRMKSIYCEVVNSGEIYDGTVTMSLYDNNDVLISSDSQMFKFSKPVNDDSSMALPLVGGITISILLISIIFTILLIKYRGRLDDGKQLDTEKSGPPISGPPISMTTVNPVHQPLAHVNNTHDTPQDDNEYPPIPEEGLPQGWTTEQWRYYGQQYLDMKNRM